MVDPELLRALAAQTDVASSMIAEADAGDKASDSADGLPGSTTQWAARLVGAHVAEHAKAISSNVSRIGVAVRGASNAYELTDSELASSLKNIF